MSSSKRLEKIDFAKVRKNIPINKETLKVIKGLKLKIEKLDLVINIGIDDAALVSYIVATISGIISIVLPYLIRIEDINKCKYRIIPIYNQNTFNLYLDSIINLKIVHIIYVIYNLVKKGRDEKNERTSNRRSYAYCDEFN